MELTSILPCLSYIFAVAIPVKIRLVLSLKWDSLRRDAFDANATLRFQQRRIYHFRLNGCVARLTSILRQMKSLATNHQLYI